CATNAYGSPTARTGGTSTPTASSRTMPPTTDPAGDTAAAAEGDRPVRRIVLIDDHPLVAAGLQILVAAPEPATVLLWASTLEEGLETVARDPEIALVLLDLRLPGFGGYGALDRFREQQPAMPVVVLSGSTERGLILGSLERGARGFIPKTANRDETARALQ